VQATAPVLPTGAKVMPLPGEILLDPTTVQIHGQGIHLDCYASGLDIGYWDRPADWVSWLTPQVAPGDYTLIARTACPDNPHDFSLKIATQEWFGTAPKTNAWDDYRDVPLGVIHIDRASDLTVELHARAEHWGPTNFSAVRLVPTTRPAPTSQRSQ
jgi:hypothetical protein